MEVPNAMEGMAHLLSALPSCCIVLECIDRIPISGFALHIMLHKIEGIFKSYRPRKWPLVCVIVFETSVVSGELGCDKDVANSNFLELNVTRKVMALNQIVSGTI